MGPHYSIQQLYCNWHPNVYSDFYSNNLLYSDLYSNNLRYSDLYSNNLR
jgi:hypothetical protein